MLAVVDKDLVKRRRPNSQPNGQARGGRETPLLGGLPPSLSRGVASRRKVPPREVLAVCAELGAREAEPHRYRFDDGAPYLNGYLIPWDVVNAY